MNEQLEKLFIEIVTGMEQAKQQIELMRAAKQEEQVDGRALSIAVTNLETAMLWVANARR
jgi:trimethylamine:corrinoid methyltransferase-like protein